jgi:putative glycosyltransferase (TIGR04348 family)
MLRDRFRIIVQTQWDGAAADAMVALHARRSADSVERFHARAAGRRIAVVLTGTDLYKDLPGSVEAARTIDLADRIVVLQDDALRLLSDKWRGKAEVIFQSAERLATRPKPRDRLDCVVVGHLREEKDPLTLFRALAQLPPAAAIRVRHIGAPLDPQLGNAARALARKDPRYRYAGALPRGLTRAAIARAHCLVHPSVVEGGANVIVEAITAGTWVIASRISGNIGMLGADYPGFFEARDASGLAETLLRALEETRYRRELAAACAKRRALFSPRREALAVTKLVRTLLA